MRIPTIAGNWKMHMTKEEAVKYIEELKGKVAGTDVEVIICPPFTLLEALKESTENTNIKIGSQNIHWEEKGAYTGEISPIMLKDLKIDYTIIGHSERRQYFNESDETVNKKVNSALKHGIKPIVCVGETLEQRKSGDTENVIRTQISEALKSVDKDDVKLITIAYEPIWAIGTGETATPEEANKVISYIRELLTDIYDVTISEEIRIQYGGSVKANNISELMNQDDIDGALVGGASLDPNSFAEIVNF